MYVCQLHTHAQVLLYQLNQLFTPPAPKPFVRKFCGVITHTPHENTNFNTQLVLILNLAVG